MYNNIILVLLSSLVPGLSIFFNVSHEKSGGSGQSGDVVGHGGISPHTHPCNKRGHCSVWVNGRRYVTTLSDYITRSIRPSNFSHETTWENLGTRLVAQLTHTQS